jgi:hypothetical protein
VLLLGLALSGCAKSPTIVETEVDADATVPPLLLLHVTVVPASDPSKYESSSLRSLLLGDAADRPDPYPFPVFLPLGVDPSYGGTVTITIEGLDWDTHDVVATGSTSAQVIAEQQTQARLTLTAAPPAPAGDGGADAGADADAAP